jgi:hypothetical protein
VAWFLCLRIQQRSIEHAMDLTDSFTWESLPTRDTESGRLSAAGWIPLIKMFSTRAAIVNVFYHFGQSTIRIVTNHDTMIIAWYPFDWTVSPFYELVNISQVTISVDHHRHNFTRSLLIIFLRFVYSNIILFLI